jgi:long-chain acyl-CoA synthetase
MTGSNRPSRADWVLAGFCTYRTVSCMTTFNPVSRRFLTRTLNDPGAVAVLAEVDISAEELRLDVLAAVAWLLDRGVAPGDRVAVLWPTEYAHTVVDLAVLCVGAVSVPVYETDSVEQIEWILSDADPVGAICHSLHRDRLDAAVTNLAHNAWVENEVPSSRDTDHAAATELHVRAVCDALTPETPAMLIYTSGTTGRAKGCTITHGNLSFGVDAATSALPELLGPAQRTVLFLPLAHVFARVVQYACVCAGVQIAYSTPTAIVEDLAKYRPTWLTVVPRVLEKVLASARQQAHGPKAKIFALAERTAIKTAELCEAGTRSWGTELLWKLCDRLVYSKLRARLGGDLRYVLSGGAPLDADVDRFFTGAGMCVLEGYGLTETTAAHTVSTPAAKRAGTVGRPLAGTGVRIHDGEVLVSGPNIFAGYWRNEAATEAAFIELDGERWFRTGDQGRETDGFVSITGRIKDLIVTANGKNVQPTGLEEIVVRHAAFSQCVVVGDRRAFITALLAVDPAWLVEQGISQEEAPGHPLVKAAADEALEAANASVSRAESIRMWRLLPGELSVESGELTATLKTKRPVVLARHFGLIEEMYS